MQGVSRESGRCGSNLVETFGSIYIRSLPCVRCNGKVRLRERYKRYNVSNYPIECPRPPSSAWLIKCLFLLSTIARERLFLLAHRPTSSSMCGFFRFYLPSTLHFINLFFRELPSRYTVSWALRSVKRYTFQQTTRERRKDRPLLMAWNCCLYPGRENNWSFQTLLYDTLSP